MVLNNYFLKKFLKYVIKYKNLSYGKKSWMISNYILFF